MRIEIERTGTTLESHCRTIGLAVHWRRMFTGEIHTHRQLNFVLGFWWVIARVVLFETKAGGAR